MEYFKIFFILSALACTIFNLNIKENFKFGKLGSKLKSGTKKVGKFCSGSGGILCVGVFSNLTGMTEKIMPFIIIGAILFVVLQI